MTYTEYKSLRAQNKVLAGINNSTALHMISLLPKRYQYAHYFWSWVCFLSIPAFICVSIFYKWWVGLVLLFTATPIVFKATKKSAADFVLEYAEENELFFNLLVSGDMLIFKYT